MIEHAGLAGGQRRLHGFDRVGFRNRNQRHRAGIAPGPHGSLTYARADRVKVVNEMICIKNRQCLRHGHSVHGCIGWVKGKAMTIKGGVPSA